MVMHLRWRRTLLQIEMKCKSLTVMSVMGSLRTAQRTKTSALALSHSLCKFEAGLVAKSTEAGLGL